MSDQHQIYLGHHLRGGTSTLFGKCRCGAYLIGQEAIDRHREEYCR